MLMHSHIYLQRQMQTILHGLLDMFCCFRKLITTGKSGSLEECFPVPSLIAK